MNSQAAASSLKILSYVVLLAMAATLVYAAYIALTHWSGIGV
jgi:hypothetical protein